MKKRLWTSEQKLQIVMQGIKGRAVSEICNEHQIGQSQYYLWRAPVFAERGQSIRDAAKGAAANQARTRK